MIREEDGQYCLYTKDGARKLGCHASREEAIAQEYVIRKKQRRSGAGFDENQARDEKGKWTDSGGSFEHRPGLGLVPVPPRGPEETLEEYEQRKVKGEHTETQHEQHEAEHLPTDEILLTRKEEATFDQGLQQAEYIDSALTQNERDLVVQAERDSVHVGWGEKLRANPDAINADTDEGRQMRSFDSVVKSAPAQIPPITTYRISNRVKGIEIGDEITTKGFNESTPDPDVARDRVGVFPKGVKPVIWKIEHPQGLLLDSGKAQPKRHVSPHNAKYVLTGQGWTDVKTKYGTRRILVYEVEQQWIH